MTETVVAVPRASRMLAARNLLRRLESTMCLLEMLKKIWPSRSKPGGDVCGVGVTAGGVRRFSFLYDSSFSDRTGHAQRVAVNIS